MALKVEDGTGGDALITRQQFIDYCTAKGYDTSDFDPDVDFDPAIRRASTYISTGWNWQGFKVAGRSQILAWPRSGVVDNDGYGVDFNSIPREVQDATCEASFYELEHPNGLMPIITLTDRVASETVGPISTTYFNQGADISASAPVLTILNEILKPLLMRGDTSFTSRANRG